KRGGGIGGRAPGLLVGNGEEPLAPIAIGGGDRRDARPPPFVYEAGLQGPGVAPAPAPRLGGKDEGVLAAPAGAGAARPGGARPAGGGRRGSGARPEVGVGTAQCARSVYKAIGTPWRSSTWHSADKITATLSPPSCRAAYSTCLVASSTTAIKVNQRSGHNAS